MQPEPGDLHLELDSSPLAVRGALAQMTRYLQRRCPGAGLGAAETVLAEALNNIVEHAYAGGRGRIRLCLRIRGNDIHCCIADQGHPMPGGTPPRGELAPLPPDAPLPEGGFGWHLIRALSQDIAYQHESGRNCLSFRVSAEQ